jgi:hypothetical protein
MKACALLCILCRWDAPETLLHRVHSYSSDMYQYATCLFEVFVGEPWAGLSIAQIVARKSEGRSLAEGLPPTLPPDLRAVMAQCWAVDPTGRPTAEATYRTLARLLGALTGVVEEVEEPDYGSSPTRVTRVQPRPVSDKGPLAAGGGAAGGAAGGGAGVAALAGTPVSPIEYIPYPTFQ